VLAWQGSAAVVLKQLPQAAVLLLHPLPEWRSGMLQQVCAAHCAAPTLLCLPAATLHPPGQTFPPQSPKTASSSCTSDDRLVDSTIKSFEEVTAVLFLDLPLRHTGDWLHKSCTHAPVGLSQLCIICIHAPTHVLHIAMTCWPDLACMNKQGHIPMHDSLIQPKVHEPQGSIRVA